MERKKQEPTSPGDQIHVHISLKQGLPKYSSLELGTGVTLTRREGETDDEAWTRAWTIVEKQLDEAHDRAQESLSSTE